MQRRGWLSLALWEKRQASEQVRADCPFSKALSQDVLSLCQRSHSVKVGLWHPKPEGVGAVATLPRLRWLGARQALLLVAFEDGPGHLEAWFRVSVHTWLLQSCWPGCHLKLDQESRTQILP